jgi:prophage endopeptidase
MIIAVEFLAAVVVVLVLSSQLTKQKARADSAESLAKQRQETINDMQTRQRDVAALDAKYTGELADAKASIDQLESDVAAGRMRLQLNAKCPAGSTATSSGLGDATGPRLNDAAERDYWRLRAGIETVTGQVSYLQQYIREQCRFRLQ